MIIFCSSEYANRTVGLLGVQRFVFEKFVDAKIDNSKTLETFSLIWRLLLLAALVGCAASQAAQEIQQGRRALLIGKPDAAVQHFEKAAALDSKNSSSPLQESAWTYVGRAYYEAGKYSLARRLSSGLSPKIKTTISRVCTSGLSAHASGRTKPTVNSFRSDCKESMIVSTTLSASRSRAISGIRQVSLAPSC